MTENTTPPAVERAAEVLLPPARLPRTALHITDAMSLAHAALTAALDVEEIARAIHDGKRRRGETLREWDTMPERWREFYRADARAVIAYLLGGAA